MILVSFFSYQLAAQKPLTPSAIKDFATQSFYHYKYGSDFFRAVVYKAFSSKNYTMPDIAVAMESLVTDKKSRDILLEEMHHQFGSRDNQFLFQQLYSLGITALHSKEIVNYINERFVIKLDKQVLDTATSSKPRAVLGRNQKK